MKYFVVFALIASVASAASYLKPTGVTEELAHIQEVIAAIQSPSTDPTTAQALWEMLEQLFAAESPISVGPAIVEESPISVGPAIVEEVSPVVVPSPVAVPSPVGIPAAATPLVQIIVNVNQANADSVVAGAPAATPVEAVPEPVSVAEITPEAVSVVESAPESVSVVEVAPESVSVVEVAPEPVSVVEVAPEPIVVVEAPESIAISPVNPIPIIPEIAMPAPETLN